MWFPLESVIFGSTPPLVSKSSTIVALFLSSSSTFKISVSSSSAFRSDNFADIDFLPHYMCRISRLSDIISIILYRDITFLITIFLLWGRLLACSMKWCPTFFVFHVGHLIIAGPRFQQNPYCIYMSVSSSPMQWDSTSCILSSWLKYKIMCDALYIYIYIFL